MLKLDVEPNIDNIDLFNEMSAKGVMGDEDRVSLLAEIGGIRDKYKLFPITVTIGEQQRQLLAYDEEVEDAEEQISLRRSLLNVQIPLLHEEDLTRFIDDYLRPNRLMVNNRCVINNVLLQDTEQLSVVPHQQARCEFYWYTLHREPFLDEGIDYE